MVTLLSKLWIKSDNYKDSKVREKYGVLCGAVGIFLNVLLFLGKFFAGLLSGAISITADAFNNLSDAGSSFISMIGFKLAGRKPDPDHPFGHGRMEYISGLFVAVMIILMAYELIKDSIGKILHPELPKFSILVAVILVVSIGVKIYMYFYNGSIGRKIESAAMIATAKDSLSDTFSTMVVLASALAAHFWKIPIDGYCGFLVGVMILIAGITAMRIRSAHCLARHRNQSLWMRSRRSCGVIKGSLVFMILWSMIMDLADLWSVCTQKFLIRKIFLNCMI